MKAAIFGGSFDPPHIGHLAIIKAALEILPIDRLFVVPAYQNPFKKGSFAPPEKRVAWLKKITKPFKKTKVCDCEIAKAGPSYTIDTVLNLKPYYDEIYLIIGADNLASLPSWHRYDELKTLVTFVVATRKKIPVPEGFIVLPIDADVSSTELRDEPRREFLPKSIADDVIKFYKERHARENKEDRCTFG